MEEEIKDSITHNLCNAVKNISFMEVPDEEIPNLPLEIIAEILLKLPVKPLLKFKCVSKAWFSLISSPNFIKTHLKNAFCDASFSNHRIMLTICHPQFNLKHCLAGSMFNEPVLDAIDINYPMKHPHRAVWVVGSCNGLICLAIDEKDLFLWNPSLRISRKLPPVGVKQKQGFYYIYGFGYDEPNDDYKVVGIFCDFGQGAGGESMVKIYSLRNDSWKRIENFKGGLPLDDSGKFLNGKLHFSATFLPDSLGIGWNIITLDLENEVYGTVEHGKYKGCYSDSNLGVLQGCLSVLCNYSSVHVDLWVLKEYGVKESWTKVVTIPYALKPTRAFYSNPLCMLDNGKILLVHGVQFVVYDPKDNSLTRPQINNLEPFLEADLYVESLIPLPNQSLRRLSDDR